MSSTDASPKDPTARVRSIFCGLGRSTGEMNMTLLETFRKLTQSNEEINDLFRIGEIKISSRMTVNKAPRTLAFVTWREQERIFGSYFTLEDEFPCPGSIIDLSESVRFS